MDFNLVKEFNADFAKIEEFKNFIENFNNKYKDFLSFNFSIENIEKIIENVPVEIPEEINENIIENDPVEIPDIINNENNNPDLINNPLSPLLKLKHIIAKFANILGKILML